MTQYNWNWWFILSIIWLISLLLVAMIGHPIVGTTFFGFAMAVCCINVLGCLYIGCKPGAIEED